MNWTIWQLNKNEEGTNIPASLYSAVYILYEYIILKRQLSEKFHHESTCPNGFEQITILPSLLNETNP